MLHVLENLAALGSTDGNWVIIGTRLYERILKGTRSSPREHNILIRNPSC